MVRDMSFGVWDLGVEGHYVTSCFIYLATGLDIGRVRNRQILSELDTFYASTSYVTYGLWCRPSSSIRLSSALEGLYGASVVTLAW